MKNLFVLGLITLASLTVQAREDETVIVNRSYEMVLNTGNKIQCSNPVNSKYPVQTALSYNQPNYELWLRGIWTNVSQYTAEAGFIPCSHLADLSKKRPVVIVEQTVTVGKRFGASGHCMHETREVAKFNLEGIQFNGATNFVVGPLDAKECE